MCPGSPSYTNNHDFVQQHQDEISQNFFSNYVPRSKISNNFKNEMKWNKTKLKVAFYEIEKDQN